MSSSSQAFDSGRKLCPDGACIGVLDDANHCRECGRTWSGNQVVGSTAPTPSPPGADAAPLPDVGTNDSSTLEGAFNPNRRLCPDGTCVGVIGSDGRCPVCGAKADA